MEAAGGADAENSVRVSHLELFNEELIDLLGFSDDANKPLRLFEHPKVKLALSCLLNQTMLTCFVFVCPLGWRYDSQS